LTRTTEYRPEMCKQIIEHMSTGASATSFAAQVGVTRRTVTNWCKNFPEFEEAFMVGKASAAAWWEERARILAETGVGSAPVTIFGLKNFNRDDFEDVTKTSLQNPDGTNLSFNVVLIPAPSRDDDH